MTQISRPKAKAREILSDLRIDSPELLRCLKEICCERGAFVKEQELDDAEARLVVSGNRGIITVRVDEAYPTRTRFSIAHELGHFELHRDRESLWACTSRDMGSQPKAKGPALREELEQEANEFAAELLMPEHFAKPEFAKAEPSLAHIKDVGSRFQMSLSATACRFAEVTDEACAVVFSRAGQITHSVRSALFEKQKYWIPPGPLSAYSHAFSAHAGKPPAQPGMIPVDASAWFQVPPYLAGQELLEHSEHFRSLDLGITLLWIKPGRLIRHP